MNQDMWWMNENHEFNHYCNNSYNDEFYDNGCDYDDPYESYDNDWQWTDNSAQNQYQGSSSFSENQERSDEYSFDDKLDQILDMIEESPYFSEIQESSEECNNNMWKQMMEMQEDNSKSVTPRFSNIKNII